MKQPEALRLADELDSLMTPYTLETKAAAELRRQHALILEMREALQECIGVVEGLEAKAAIWRVIGNKARAAIEKASNE